jgi:hypothetical protein
MSSHLEEVTLQACDITHEFTYSERESRYEELSHLYCFSFNELTKNEDELFVE